jgi:hypothetical protein
VNVYPFILFLSCKGVNINHEKKNTKHTFAHDVIHPASQNCADFLYGLFRPSIFDKEGV